MATYRYQVVNVGLWRGKIKRWNTTFHYSSSGATAALYTRVNKMGYKAPGDVTGDCSGGVASISVYNSSGGAPISRTVYFDWEAPGTWIPYTGEIWASIPADVPPDAAGESALVVVGNMSALSSTGKPVTTRKYFHAVPSRSAVDYSDPDISATVVAAAEGVFSVGYLANPAGVSPSTITVPNYYMSHQRVRGRRRTAKALAAASFSSGVVLGSGVGGGGATFPHAA